MKLVEERRGEGASLSEALPRDVSDRLDALPSPASQRGVLCQIRAVCRWALREGLALRDPTKGLRVEGRNPAGKETLTKAEARRFEAVLLEGDSDAALGLLLCLRLGLRNMEVRLARVRAVDLEGKPATWYVERRSTKTDRGVRTLALPPVVAARLARRIDGRAFSDALFPGIRGCVYHSKDWLKTAARRFCKAAGVPYVCPQGLRDTHAQLAALHGASIDAVSMALGHEDETTTIRSYVTEAVVERARADNVTRMFEPGRDRSSGAPR